MKTILCAAGALLCATSLAYPADMGGDKAGPVRLDPEHSRYVKVGATLELEAPNLDPEIKGTRHYEWRRNGVPLGGKTNKFLKLQNISSDDAATYRVVITGATVGQSALYHVNVYSLFTNQSNGGYLTAPIGEYITQPLGTVCAGSATTFNRYKVYMTFDAPNATPSSDLFRNTSGETNLLISTCTNANGTTLNTAIQVVRNDYPYSLMGCDDNEPSFAFNTKLSNVIVTNLGSTQKYRAAIYFKYGTLGSVQAVTFKWKYTDGFTW